MTTQTRLSIAEDMTIYHALEHKHRLVEALDAADGLELDLSQVREIDTAGVQLLILTKREAAKRSKSLAIVAHSPAVRETLDFCNLMTFFVDPVVITAREQC